MMSTLTAEEVDACIDDLAFSLGELKTSDAEGPLPIEENEEYTHAILERHKELFAKSEDKKIATCIKYHRRGNVPSILPNSVMTQWMHTNLDKVTLANHYAEEDPLSKFYSFDTTQIEIGYAKKTGGIQDAGDRSLGWDDRND